MSCPGSVLVVSEGGVKHWGFSLPLAVPLVGAHAGGVGHGVGDVVLLLDALEEVGHGSAREHCHILSAVGGRLCGDGSQLDVVFSFWKTNQKLYSNACSRLIECKATIINICMSTIHQTIKGLCVCESSRSY